MSGITGNNKQPDAKKGNQLGNKIIPLLTLLLAIAITLGIFLCRERVAELGSYGYLGAFLISLTFNATIILPTPGIVILFALGAVFNPLLVGLAGAAGGAIGEITGYMAGYSGRGIAQRGKTYATAEDWLRRWGALAIFVFTVMPFLPIDLAGIAAGVLRFPLWKFLLVCWFGKVILYTGAALAGAYGWAAVVPYLNFQ